MAIEGDFHRRIDLSPGRTGGHFFRTSHDLPHPLPLQGHFFKSVITESLRTLIPGRRPPRAAVVGVAASKKHAFFVIFVPTPRMC